MNRFFLIALFLSFFAALPCALHSQVIVKDFQQIESKSKTVQQTVTVVEGVKVPYVADISKLKRTTDLPLEERKVLEEEFAPDSVFVKKLKQQDQAVLQQNGMVKMGKMDKTDETDETEGKSFVSTYQIRWFPQEAKKE